MGTIINKVVPIWCLVLAIVVAPTNAEKMLEESREDFMARVKDEIQVVFDEQTQTSAMWVGLSDPYYGDMLFLFENDELINRANNADDYYVPAAMEQNFDIGSISKTFGGTAAILLAERGDLALSDTVSDLVPDFAAQFPEYADYTVEELLRMKTIVPDFLNDEEGTFSSLCRVLLRIFNYVWNACHASSWLGYILLLEMFCSFCLSKCLNHDSPDPLFYFLIYTSKGILNDFALDITKRYSTEDVVAYAMQKYPAELGTYSTTNFVVLDFILETVTGQSIQDVVKELILDPLGMESTVLPDRFSEGTHPDPSSTPYAGPACRGEFVRYGFPNLALYQDMSEIAKGVVMAGTGGAINSNITDLLTWAKSGTGDSLLSAEMVELRHQYDNTLTAGVTYGIAQYVYPSEYLDDPIYGLTYLKGWYGHSGDAFGFGAHAYRNDELNASVATAVNTCSYSDVQLGAIKIFTEELQKRNYTEVPTDPEGDGNGSGSGGAETTAAGNSMGSRWLHVGFTLALLVAGAIV